MISEILAVSEFEVSRLIRSASLKMKASHEGAFEGKGYAFEAAQAYLTYASDALHTHSLLIRIEKHNQRSLRLAERIRTTRDDAAKPPAWMPDTVTYRIKL